MTHPLSALSATDGSTRTGTMPSMMPGAQTSPMARSASVPPETGKRGVRASLKAGTSPSLPRRTIPATTPPPPPIDSTRPESTPLSRQRSRRDASACRGMVSFPRRSRNSRLNGQKAVRDNANMEGVDEPASGEPASRGKRNPGATARRLGLPCLPFPPVLVRATDHGRTTMIRRSLLLPLLAVLLVGCDPAPKAAGDTAAAPEATALPLFDTFGDLHHDVASRVPAAQRYFDQGLRMAYGFNHEAAGRAFAEAARLDPQCAMCVWGQALVLGPNINLPMDPAHAKDATALAARAASLAATARPVDRALIQALQLRYADPA